MKNISTNAINSRRRMSHAGEKLKTTISTQYRYLKRRRDIDISYDFSFLFIYFRAILLIILFCFTCDRVSWWNLEKNIALRSRYSLFPVHQLSKNNGYRCTPKATVGDVRSRAYVCDFV